MGKRFNITGTCIPEKHYMADTSQKISETIRLIEQDSYFTINRARQYGKTTILLLLWKQLKDNYIIISISFEGLGSEAFSTEDAFTRRFCARAAGSLKRAGYPQGIQKFWEPSPQAENLDTLKDRIASFCEQAGREVLLFIDEIDKSCNNQMFLNFLGILRELYLERAMGAVTFKSVILAGVYDIKNLKLKIRPNEEQKYNSPWNIAIDFSVDMNLAVPEILSMLMEYQDSRKIQIDAKMAAHEIYRYTGGYPFLVSLVCLWLDERLPHAPGTAECWTKEGIHAAIREILKTTYTLFDDIIKNIENNPTFRTLIEAILLEGSQIPYTLSNPQINLGTAFGIITEADGICKIANIIFETYIYDHLIAAKLMERKILPVPRSQFITKTGTLDMNAILEKFQQFMKAEYSIQDRTFLETQGRLLFLAFLKPIINGTGHYAVEPETRDNTRMDIAVFYGMKEYILELKIWHGPKQFYEGISQLASYMDHRGQTEGWMLTFCFQKNYEELSAAFNREITGLPGKKIYSVII